MLYATPRSFKQRISILLISIFAVLPIQSGFAETTEFVPMAYDIYPLEAFKLPFTSKDKPYLYLEVRQESVYHPMETSRVVVRNSGAYIWLSILADPVSDPVEVIKARKLEVGRIRIVDGITIHEDSDGLQYWSLAIHHESNKKYLNSINVQALNSRFYIRTLGQLRETMFPYFDLKVKNLVNETQCDPDGDDGKACSNSSQVAVEQR